MLLQHFTAVVFWPQGELKTELLDVSSSSLCLVFKCDRSHPLAPENTLRCFQQSVGFELFDQVQIKMVNKKIRMRG